MKAFRFFTLFTFLILFHNLVFAQNEVLTVEDPQRWSSTRPATIEKTLISLSPKGVYTEVGLYLTISGQGENFSAGTQLEIVMDFNLPEGSIIHDSWLWVGNEIIRAKILDKWSANLIYEDIVDRRQDPSILFKLTQNSYKLRIYPLIFGESRQVKISYLVPNTWTDEKVLTTLPLNILNLSKSQIPQAELIIWESDDFKTPTIFGTPLENKQDSVFGDYFYADISNSIYPTLGQLEYEAPLSNGVYVNSYVDGNEQFYQIAMPGNNLFDKNQSKEVMVMFDHDSNNSNVTSSSILEKTKIALKENLSKDDFFNLAKSGLFTKTVSDIWLPGDDASIDQAFEALGELNNYSSLASVVSEGVEFVTEYGGQNTSFLLISNTDEIDDLQLANEFLNEVQNLITDINAPFHVYYYQNRRFNQFYANGRYYYSGNYIYSNLASLTGGEFIQFSSSIANIDQGLKNIMMTLGQAVDFFDFYTTTESGFCHSRFSNFDGEVRISPDKPIVQVGKYEGEAPFIIRMSGSLNGEIKSKEIVVQQGDVKQADSLSREAWVGNRLKLLEEQANTNEDISQIIKLSLDERVLSKYTAFLCLEPSQGGEPCLDCLDENGIVTSDIQETVASDSLIVEVAPNPFADQVTITVEKPNSVKTNEVSCQIFDALGIAIKNLESTSVSESKVQFSWDGTKGNSQVGAGMYIGVIRAGDMQKTIKLIYQP